MEFYTVTWVQILLLPNTTTSMVHFSLSQILTHNVAQVTLLSVISTHIPSYFIVHYMQLKLWSRIWLLKEVLSFYAMFIIFSGLFISSHTQGSLLNDFYTVSSSDPSSTSTCTISDKGIYWCLDCDNIVGQYHYKA